MQHPIGRVFMAVTLLAVSAMVQAADKLYLFNWADYMPPDVIRDFEQQYDVDVVQSYYSSNAEMLAKLRSGGDRQYDVVFPTDYFVTRLIRADLLQPLGEGITGRGHLFDEFRDPSYDPGARYSVPYQWGDTGIVYNTRTMPNLPHSWDALYDPEVNPDQPFALLKGDGQFSLATLCAWQGHGFDCTERDQWVAAAKAARSTMDRPNFSGFVNGLAAIDQVARGIIQVGIAYNGDYVHKVATGGEAYQKVGFFVPEEGSQRWVDSMVIPKHAPHPELARQFISYLLQPGIAARISNYTGYTTPNRDALSKLNATLREPPALPNEATRQRLSVTPALSGEDLQFVQQLWTEVRSR
ncbi:ABC transporter substrate-binding protein [Kushneria phosphatilytica]|uniref:Spermidine/putrescine ABC transporter substrate-binding protein n=1 Tax=Kushneria phosphatilytica TaxID=657387 RepID=A0A1S1NXT6_9GAMM|nr:spermidine/putrescine ABC transporter substrate-binding protein [Kushneria phosphatilytica]OHV12278.1 ABC transporter substrate-binding protein [Kushneria phosphatilytica]QEL11480.1 spermidine/putrescine ABC transporter substrate-binding protein [Kushneria phosphatilytica]